MPAAKVDERASARARKNKKRPAFDTSHPNSLERKILTGEFLLPGLDKKQTVEAYRQWQRDNKANNSAIERWYRFEVQDRGGHDKNGPR